MEATRGQEYTGLLHKIPPPRVEDAGLEDCALLPDSIHEAFLKAASAVKSRTDTLYHSDDGDEVKTGFIDDPFPEKGKCFHDILSSPPCPDLSDAVVVAGSSRPSADSVERCVKETGGGREVVEGKERMVVGGDGGEVVAGKGFLDDELKGLKIRETEEKKNENQEDDERGKENPILV